MTLPPVGDSILVLLLNRSVCVCACMRACVCVCLSMCVSMHVCCKFVSDNWVYAQLEVCYVYEILTHSCTFCQHIPTQFTTYLFRLHNYLCGVVFLIKRTP